jgi:hypothetical protein
MVVAGFQAPGVCVWDLDSGDSEAAAWMREVLVEDLQWKDPLLAHDSEDSEEEGEDEEEEDAAI